MQSREAFGFAATQLESNGILAPACIAVLWVTSGKRSIYQRGDEFYDWDGHAFHFFGGIPLNNDGSLALYEGKEQEEYLRELAESLKKGAQP